ncbi:hypothetical protein FALBO_7892 [Fusarium albosuccineum]|uniref:Uncharacterized protein n=1 Tax=Fusarium albosuccineum TaxID=1237068 RepID=A0A8H4LBZ0_9HYPO|nr:hypothetical protein FALBO_7892 [Fusarium albosuccineum]
MLPAANIIPVGSKVLPVALAVGGATVAGGYARSHTRTPYYNTQYNAPRAQPVQTRTDPAPRSKYFELVLESIFA